MRKFSYRNGPSRGRFIISFLRWGLFCSLVASSIYPATAAEQNGQAARKALEFDDQPRVRELKHPQWFKQSFLDLRQDMREALKQGKKGLILYFSQENCGYCEAFIERNLGLQDITTYIQRHFDVLHLDIWGDRELIDFDGDRFTEREFSILHNTNFTPSLMFYVADNKVADNKVADNKLALFLRGFHDPYRFRAALRYVTDEIYKQSGLPEYMSRAEDLAKFELGDLNQQAFFIKPPYILSRSRIPADRPLLVVFESRDCHACDVMHADTFKDQDIRNRLELFEVVQLDMHSEQPLITPLGDRTNAAKWARRLGVVFAPTLILFDKTGKEIIRLDSITKVFRMGRVLDFVLSEGFREGNYQQWRLQMRRSN